MRTNVTVHLAEIEALSELAALRASLNETDWQRADEIRSAPRRGAFLATRRLLREVLSARLRCPPATLPIILKPNDKPRHEGDEVEFSVAHCDRWCAVALSDGCPVGVDVERIRPFAELTEVVKEFFPPTARAAYAAAPHGQQLAVFYHWWTRIEAAVKAAGRGLADAPACLEDALGESFDQVPGLATAVAVRGRGPLAVAWHVWSPGKRRTTSWRQQRAQRSSLQSSADWPGVFRVNHLPTRGL